MKETLKEMVVRIIKEETGKVTAKPVVKKGDKVRVFDLESRDNYMVTASTNSEWTSGSYTFFAGKNLVISWDPKLNQWEMDPDFQED